jgi:hypothetical protein
VRGLKKTFSGDLPRLWYEEFGVIAFLGIFCFIIGCSEPNSGTGPTTRAGSIPPIAEKILPENDYFQPVLQVEGWQEPIPLAGPVNTAGAEDSPFITPSGEEFYFFFTPDLSIPAEQQLLDQVTGVWKTQKVAGQWTEPERVVLGKDVSLDGAVFILGNVMWFASVRAGNYGEVDYYTAFAGSKGWTSVQNAGKQLNQDYDVGELHISADGQRMYCGGPENWGDFTGKDIYVLYETAEGWTLPIALPAPLNTPEYNEDQPFLSSDGTELWFTGQSRRGYPGPAVFKALKVGDSWKAPIEIISNFAGEPTLDEESNIYFVHHFVDQTMNLIEADIYFVRRQ